MNSPERTAYVRSLAPHSEALPSRRLTALLVWCSLTVLCSMYATIPLLPAFVAEFGAPLTAVAWTGSAFSLGYIAGCAIFGALAERYGARAVILSGMFLLAAVTPFIGLAHSLAELIVLRGLQGAAAASYAPAALAYVAQAYPERSKVRTLGYITTALLSAGVIGQLIGGAVADVWHWPAVFYMLSAVYILNAALIKLWMTRPVPGQTQADVGLQPLRFYPKLGKRILAAKPSAAKPFTVSCAADGKQAGLLRSQYRAVLVSKKLYPPFAITVTALFAFVAMYTLLGIKLSGPGFQMSESDILYVRSLGLLGIALSPLAGKLIPRFGHANVLRFNLALCIAGALGIGSSSSLAVIAPLSIIFVAGIALTTPVLISLISRIAEGAASLAINVYSLILFVGATLGPVAAVYGASLAGVAPAFVLLALTLGAAFICTLAIRYRR